MSARAGAVVIILCRNLTVYAHLLDLLVKRLKAFRKIAYIRAPVVHFGVDINRIA